MSSKTPAVKQTQKVRLAKTSTPLVKRTWFQATLVLAMGAALAAVIVFQPSDRSPIPEVSVGDPAPRDIHAPHSLTIVTEDTSGLEESRNEEASRVLPVWDFDDGLGDDAAARVSQGFQLMRQYLRQEADEQLQLLGERAGAQEGTGELDLATADDPLIVLSEAQRERVSLAHRADFIRAVQAGVDVQAIQALGREGFTTEAEALVVQFISELLSSPIVHSRDVLLAEQENGITRRILHDGGVVDESVLRDFDDFVDQADVGQRLEDIATTQLPVDYPSDFRQALVSLAHEIARANVNTRFNSAETAARRDRARAAIEPTTDTVTYREGDLLVHAGQIVTEDDRELLQVAATAGPRDEQAHANEVVIGGVIYVLLILLGIFTYGIRFLRRFEPDFKDLAFMTAILFVMVTLTKAILMLAGLIGAQNPDFPLAAVYAAIPFAAGGILVRLVLNSEHALIFAIVYSLLVALLLPDYPVFAAYALVGSLTGIGAVDAATTRMTVFRAGLLVGLVNAAFAAAMALLDSSFVEVSTLLFVGFALFSGLLAAILATALLPLVETIFHYITDMKLLELANPNHPAVRDLLLRAPGSYQHSMMVGSLVEAGCKAIAAHALLGRVGAYYHDIGKSKNPRFFAENQSGKNPHDKLKPHMSALIIKSHVKDGVEMAQSYGLPEEIIRFIQEHHGTSLISYFYHKAKELEDPDIQEVDEEDFRYPGPKPQTTETAVCMLADGIEAASRAMQEPTPARLQGLVQRMINNAFSDGQLDECDLTLRDLDAIAREFIRILVSIYHQRPEYPDKKKEAEQKRHTSSTTLPQVQAKEESNGSGDSSPVDGGEERSEPEPPEEESTATLRRLGIDQGRAIDPSNRRQ